MHLFSDKRLKSCAIFCALYCRFEETVKFCLNKQVTHSASLSMYSTMNSNFSYFFPDCRTNCNRINEGLLYFWFLFWRDPARLGRDSCWFNSVKRYSGNRKGKSNIYVIWRIIPSCPLTQRDKPENTSYLTTHSLWAEIWTQTKTNMMQDLFKVKTQFSVSASLSWCQHTIWGPWSDFYYCQIVAGSLFDERKGLSFITPADPRQRSHSRLWLYFTVSESRLPQPGRAISRYLYLPGTWWHGYQGMMEVFEPASTRGCYFLYFNVWFYPMKVLQSSSP
jgi:hypothetical protein